MAIVSNILIGKASGSVGNATFSTWKGKNVLKSKPTSVANPQTAGQTAQRTRMTIVVALYRAMASLLDIGFLNKAVGKSAYNAFVGTNLDAAIISTNPAAVFTDPSLFKTSEGTLEAEPISEALVAIGADTTDISWNSTISGDQLATDKAYAVIVSPSGVVKGISLGEAERSDGTIEINKIGATDFTANDKAYLFFYQPSSRKVSDSAYSELTLDE